MAYFHAVNTGKGFITHAENESAHVAGYPGDVWVTDNTTWASYTLKGIQTLGSK